MVRDMTYLVPAQPQMLEKIAFLAFIFEIITESGQRLHILLTVKHSSSVLNTSMVIGILELSEQLRY